MPYKENDYVYIVSFTYFYKKNDTVYSYPVKFGWCKVLSYDIETNTYDVITRFGYTQRKIPSSAIHQARTDQQGKKIRIKRLEPYYVWDKKK